MPNKINEVEVQITAPYDLEYATQYSAGLDIKANIEHPMEIYPGQVVLVPTGVYVNIPENYEIQLRSRSSLPLKRGLIVGNGIGTIDSDYKNEIKVILINITTATQYVYPFDKIAQLVIVPLARMSAPNIKINSNERMGGFGSTDK